MLSAFNDFRIVFWHELVASCRNWRTLAHAFGLPMLIVFLGVLMTVHSQINASHTLRVAIDMKATTPAGAALLKHLYESKTITVVKSTDPARDLRQRRLDAAVSLAPDNRRILVALPPSGVGESDLSPLNETLTQARDAAYATVPALTDAGPAFLHMAKVSYSPLMHSSDFIVQGAMVTLLILLSRTAFSMSFAAQSVWLEEARSKCILNVLAMPVNRFALTLAKLFVMVLIAVLSVASYVLAFAVGIFGAALTADTSKFAKAVTSSAATPTAAPVQGMSQIPWMEFTLVTMAVIFLFGCFCAAIGLVAVSILRQKELNGALSGIFTGVSLIHVLAMSPALNLDFTTQWIPVLNLVLMEKASLMNSLHASEFWVGSIEMLVLTIALTWYAIDALGRERFITIAVES
jgi:ABC-type Na+ efflux pump permease subunit